MFNYLRKLNMRRSGVGKQQCEMSSGEAASNEGGLLLFRPHETFTKIASLKLYAHILEFDVKHDFMPTTVVMQ